MPDGSMTILHLVVDLMLILVCNRDQVAYDEDVVVVDVVDTVVLVVVVVVVVHSTCWKDRRYLMIH